MKVSAKTRLQVRINSTITTLLILALAALLAWLSTRYSFQYDWTASGRHSLSEASKEVLTKLEGPVEITAYARENANLRDVIRKIVSRYQRVKPDINLHFVNPDAVPDEVRNLGINVDGELILRYQNRVEHVLSDREQEFTNALQRLARNTEHWLAFIEGHGEREALGQAGHDLSEWVSQLKHRGFKVQPLNLANIKTIPNNTRLLVIAGPRIDFLPGEVDQIISYLENGGNLLWLADPGELHGLEKLADFLHIRFQPGLIMDYTASLIGINDPTLVLMTASLYPPHPVTTDFKYTTIFPTATAIIFEENVVWDVRPLLDSGDHTWVETGSLEGEVTYDEDSDVLGPLEVGVSLERELEVEEDENLVRKNQRVIVISDGDFLSNTFIPSSGNLDLGLRLANWLSDDEDFINIPVRVAKDTNLELTPVTSVIIGFGFLFILPGMLFGTGITIWWRRRKQ